MLRNFCRQNLLKLQKLRLSGKRRSSSVCRWMSLTLWNRFCIIGIATSKASAAIFLLRITVIQWHRWLLYFMVVSVTIPCFCKLSRIVDLFASLLETTPSQDPEKTDPKLTYYFLVCALFDFIRCDPIAHVWNPTIEAHCWVSTEGFTSLSITVGSKSSFHFLVIAPANTYSHLCGSRPGSLCNSLVHSMESADEERRENFDRRFHESGSIVSSPIICLWMSF